MSANRMELTGSTSPRSPATPNGVTVEAAGAPAAPQVLDAAAAAKLTRADLGRMSPDEIVKAKAEGRLNDLLGIK